MSKQWGLFFGSAIMYLGSIAWMAQVGHGRPEPYGYRGSTHTWVRHELIEFGIVVGFMMLFIVVIPRVGIPRRTPNRAYWSQHPREYQALMSGMYLTMCGLIFAGMTMKTIGDILFPRDSVVHTLIVWLMVITVFTALARSVWGLVRPPAPASPAPHPAPSVAASAAAN